MLHALLLLGALLPGCTPPGRGPPFATALTDSAPASATFPLDGSVTGSSELPLPAHRRLARSKSSKGKGSDKDGSSSKWGTSDSGSYGSSDSKQEDSWVSDPDDPHLARDDLPRANCVTLRRICVHQETLVTHAWRYSIANPHREALPELPALEQWNFPAALEANTDALAGHMDPYRLSLRPASSAEPTPALASPVFTNHTLPVIIVCDFPYNLGEFFAKTVSAVDQLGLDTRITLAVLTPQGLGLAPFHSFLLMPYSRYPIITANDLGARGSWDEQAGRERPVPWSPEPSQPHCFERLAMCRWGIQTGGGTLLSIVAGKVVDSLSQAKLIPPSPISWGGGGSSIGGSSGGGSAGAQEGKGLDAGPDPRDNTTLRVLIETRHGPVRNIKNIQELLDACEKRRKSFSAGPFRRLACAATSFSAGAAPSASSGEASPSPSGRAGGGGQFLSNVAAVRGAHVLAVLHGAGATNSWFMRQRSSALVEIRPCRFGSHHASWPDKYMPVQHKRNRDVVKYFAYNVEDKEQCRKGDIEAALRNKSMTAANVRWDPAFFARDQHLRLRPGPFLRFLEHVAELLYDDQAYGEARDKDELHAYAVPEGLMYGKLGITDLEVYLKEHDPAIVRVD
ncbi:hypothetical protein HYH03_016111 [Edaphochlamys debaryana]|uniref:Uncharacterized protein n=1 Tax=Edaphochlamys debaryana TaxID=47281 RepID=A0A836BRS1_9CHLO|nr:hypothetical protein HYH03_016111 [Edaphochlamys debaryana]|eukprot:KAG2485124.1 hypothetical protein HYH03_016111 [Edaphochlamys debaryana]